MWFNVALFIGCIWAVVTVVKDARELFNSNKDDE